jgi:hypothetical protein
MLAKMDNFLVFAITMVLVVTAGQKLLALGFKKLGWSGPAAFFK